MVWKSNELSHFFCINLCFSGPSHDQQESSVVPILLHCIEEEMHFSVRCGAFQASYHSNSVNLKDYFCPTGLLFTCHILLLLSVAPAPSWPLRYMFFPRLWFSYDWHCWELPSRPCRLYVWYRVILNSNELLGWTSWPF